MKILFDATELSYFLEKSGHRAGVFFVALNFFRELKKNSDIDLTFFCNFKRYFYLKEVLAKVDEFKEIDLLPEKSLTNLFLAKINYIVKNAPLKIKYAVLSFLRYYENIFYLPNKKNLLQLKPFQIYLSPFSPPSEEILCSSHIKRFMMLHDVIPIIEAGGIPDNKRLWCYRLYNTINENDFYLTNSENTKKDILKYFPFIKDENIRNVYLGADDNFFPQKSDVDYKYVFSLCTLGKRKNLIFAIRNFLEFINQYKINDLYMVLGGGIWKKFEKELINSISNFDKSKIIFKGYVNDNDLPKLYSNALMFIYPSLYEGFGLPVLEAMKCGCPVITSNTSSLPEVIGDAGIKIDPTNDEDMIGAYKKMYFDTFYRELSSQRGLIRSKKFSWALSVSKTIEYISEKTSEI